MTAFDKAFDLLIGHEGAYSRDPKDRGNWTGKVVGKGDLKGTKFGISAASYPKLDIENLTLEDAKAIYRRDYWDKLRADDLPPALAYAAFDAAVNAGVSRAGRWLQLGLGVPGDGTVGPMTIKAARAVRDIKPVLIEMLAQRNEHNREAPTADTHGLGWSRRLFALSYQALFF